MRQRFLDQETTTLPRFDSETVREVLARASEIESQPESEHLTVAQIEALGTEIGLSPDAIRRALGEKVGIPNSVKTASTLSEHGATKATLTKEQVKSAIVPNLWCGLLCLPALMTLSRLTNSSTLPSNVGLVLTILLACLLPVFLAFRSGFILGQAKIGSLAGFFTVVYSLLILIVAGSLATPDFNWNDGEKLIVWLLLFGAIFGATGTLARRWWDSLPRKSDR